MSESKERCADRARTILDLAARVVDQSDKWAACGDWPCLGSLAEMETKLKELLGDIG